MCGRGFHGLVLLLFVVCAAASAQTSTSSTPVTDVIAKFILQGLGQLPRTTSTSTQAQAQALDSVAFDKKVPSPIHNTTAQIYYTNTSTASSSPRTSSAASSRLTTSLSASPSLTTSTALRTVVSTNYTASPDQQVTSYTSGNWTLPAHGSGEFHSSNDIKSLRHLAVAVGLV